MTLEGQLRAHHNTSAVRFDLTVRNRGAEPVALEFNSSQKADVTVLNDGEEIWRWSNGRMFTQALETDHLAPSEQVRYSCTWNNPSPGEYRVIAELTATNASLTASTQLTI